MRIYMKAAAVIIFIFFSCAGICGASDFEISLGTQKVRFAPYGGFEGYYDEPLSRTIVVASFPFSVDVIIKNTSSLSQQIYAKVNAGAESLISFELTGEDGAVSEMKEKPVNTDIFDDEESQYLNPGEAKRISLAINPEDWENVPPLEPGKIKKYRMRVAYQNDVEKIYSDYYEFILDGSNMNLYN